MQNATPYCSTTFTLRQTPESDPIHLAFMGPQEALIGIESYLLHDARYTGHHGLVADGAMDDLLSEIPAADLYFSILPSSAVTRAPGKEIMQLPWRINQSLVIKGKSWQEIIGDFSRVERSKGKTYLNKNYGYRISTNPEDFDLFYDNFYAPTMHGRHAATAITLNKEQARNEVFDNHGHVFWVHCNGELLSGVLCRIENDSRTLHFKLMGVKDGDERYLKQNALNAAFYFVAQWAHEHGYHRIDYQQSTPFLKKGIFQFKRKYNSTVSVPSWAKDMVISVRATHNSEQLRAFLRHNPCIRLASDGTLSAAYFTDDDNDPSLLIPYQCPGITGASIAPPATLLAGLPELPRQ